MLIKIAHFFADTKNCGDQGSALGVQKILRSVYGDIQFSVFNIDKKPISKSQINKLNKNFDALILGGGGLLYDQPKKASNFYFNMSLKNYHRLSLPKFFYGIGINAKINQDTVEIAPKTRESIRKFIDETNLVGLRDVQSVKYLREISNKEIDLVPCPSMFLLNNIEVPEKDKTFAINLTHRIKNDQNIRNFLNWFGEIGQKINLKPIFVTHYQSEDRPCLDIAKDEGIDIFVPSSPETLMEFYKKQQFLAGMRGHSLIFATGALLPMVSLPYNQKCIAHMEMLEQEKYIITQEHFGNKELLFHKIEQLLKNREIIIKQLRNKKIEYYSRNIKFAEKLISIISEQKTGQNIQ